VNESCVRGDNGNGIVGLSEIFGDTEKVDDRENKRVLRVDVKII
jgi:hypothetical protein